MSSADATAALSAQQRRLLWMVRGLAGVPVLACLVWVAQDYAVNHETAAPWRMLLVLPHVVVLVLLRERTLRGGVGLAVGWSGIAFLILGFVLLNAIGGGMVHDASFLVLLVVWHGVMFLVASALRRSLPTVRKEA